MLMILIIVVTVGVLFVYLDHNRRINTNVLNVVSTVSFLLSSVLIILWLTVSVERWQLSLNNPWSYRDSLPVWADVVQDILRYLVFGWGVSRLTLGFIYALPLMLTPILLKLVQQVRENRLILYATLLNLAFFWTQLGADYRLRGLLLKIPVQAILFLGIMDG